MPCCEGVGGGLLGGEGRRESEAGSEGESGGELAGRLTESLDMVDRPGHTAVTGMLKAQSVRVTVLVEVNPAEYVGVEKTHIVNKINKFACERQSKIIKKAANSVTAQTFIYEVHSHERGFFQKFEAANSPAIS